MGWPQSLLIGVLSCLLATVGAGLVAGLCADWYRISNFEGKAGFFIVGVALLGGVVGLAVGVGVSRIATAAGPPGFLAGLGRSLAVVLVLLGVATGLARLGADLRPTVDGHPLEVAVEVRLPEGFELPQGEVAEGYRWHLTITADTGARHQSMGLLRLDAAERVGHRWVVPGTVPLTTSSPGKSLGVGLGDGRDQYLRLPVPGRPSGPDSDWSQWLSGPTFGDLSEVPTAEAVAVRYRLQLSR